MTTSIVAQRDSVYDLMTRQHVHIAQIGQENRTLTAKNYDSGIKALGVFLQSEDRPLPTKMVLEKWRDSMLQNLAINTVKMRLAAARKLLNSVADETTDIQLKMVLRDWATVKDPKAVVIQDKIEEDYGRRLTLESVQNLISSIPKEGTKQLRDRTILALGLGAGLRVSEVVRLTVKDLMDTKNEFGQRGIHVRNSKHGKTRIVVMDGWSSWVFSIAADYLNCSSDMYPDSRVILGVKAVRNGHVSYGTHLSANNTAKALLEYPALYQGEMTPVSFHDLRRTYAYLCKRAGMSWEALALNLGHSDIRVTQRYVGTDVDWEERVPQWKIYV